MAALRAGQGDRAGLAMAVVEVHIAADQREFVRSRRQLGQQLGESNAGRAGGDRGERPAIFDRRLGLGVEEIEVARPAAQPDQQDRFGLAGFGAASDAARGRTPAQMAQPRPRERNARRLTPWQVWERKLPT